jgi:diguanylate cyclase (GGDEF)-like protein/PAS domain S-box-containing protein
MDEVPQPILANEAVIVASVEGDRYPVTTPDPLFPTMDLPTNSQAPNDESSFAAPAGFSGFSDLRGGSDTILQDIEDPDNGRNEPKLMQTAAQTTARPNSLLHTLGRITEVFRAATEANSDVSVDEVFAAVAEAFSASNTRCVLFLVSGDGTRMRLATPADERPRGWQAAVGAVAQVLAARRPIEMGIVNDEFESPEPARVRIGPDSQQSNARSFGRFVPVFDQRAVRSGPSQSPSQGGSDPRINAVIGLLRSAGQPMFEADDRILLDAAAERLETFFALRNAADVINGQRSVGLVSQQGLLVSNDLLERVGRVSGDVIFRHLFATGTEYISTGIATSLGYIPSEVTSDPFLLDRAIYPEDRYILTDIASGDLAVDRPILMRLLRRDGLVTWQLLRVATIVDHNNRVLGVEGFATDITTMKQAEASLMHQARSDALTGLANRLNFREATSRGLARIERHPGMIGVLFLDLDGFKQVNDTMGHAAGDQVLQIVADRLRTVIRREDMVARLGGDEFAILLSELRQESEAASSARRILEALEEPILVDAQVALISSGVGIAVTTSGDMTPDELINQADIALYQAKRTGRGRWQIFQGDNGSLSTAQGALRLTDKPADPSTLVKATMTAGALRASLAGGEFRVRYLPQIDTTTGRIVALEALVRWQHPTLGLLPASIFIDATMATDVIHPLGDWVLRESCNQVAQWRQTFGVDLAVRVNISGEQLARPGFADTVLTVLASTGLSPKSLGLDLSEGSIGSLTSDQEVVLDVLHRAGVGIAVDDFGTGTSSLRTLRRLPLSQIKIARSLIDEVDQAGSNDESLVQLAIKLAGSLGANVVAIGVERSTQLERLQALHCAFYQGFLAGEARTAEEITALLETGQMQLPMPVQNPQ